MNSISRRRADSESMIACTYSELMKHFTRKHVFLDNDSIPLGKSLPDAICIRLASSKVSLILNPLLPQAERPHSVTARPYSLMLFFLVLTVFAQSSFGEDTPLPIHDSLVPLTSDEGLALLEASSTKRAYVQLTTYLECQENLAFCGPASIAAVLNALQIPRPDSSRHHGYRLFDQQNIFTLGGTPPKPIQDVRRSGMSLDILASHFRFASADCSMTYASDSSVDVFRNAITSSLETPHEFVVVNYLRSAIHQEGGGHISPLAAYHAPSDQVLILDVAKYKYPPVWVELPTLFAAMSSVDGKHSRGFVIVGSTDRSQNGKPVGE